MTLSVSRFAIAPLLGLVLLAGACGNPSHRPQPTTLTPTATPGLRSFRYQINAEASGVFGGTPGAGGSPSLTILVNGDVAGPTQEYVTTKMTLGQQSIEVERIRIDDRAWTRSAPQPWTETSPSSTGGSAGIDLDPGAFLGTEPNTRLRGALNGLHGSEEQLDGAAVLKYTVDAAHMRTILGVPADQPQTTFGPIQGDSTIWVTKDGSLPVRIVTDTTPSGGGTVHVQVDFHDRNAPSISVTPPPSGTPAGRG